MHGIECDSRERPIQVLYTNSLGNSDAKFSSLGNFQICTQGMSAANVNLGELWVSYDVTFYKKQQLPLIDLVPHLNMSGMSVNGQGNWSGPLVTYSSVGITLSQPTPTTSRIHFPSDLKSGRFWCFEYKSANLGGSPITPYNAVFVQGLVGAPIASFIYDITGQNATLTYPACTGGYNWCLLIMQVPYNWTEVPS